MINITSFEEYVKILQSPYEYNPIDISVGFYGFCSYQHQAWDYVFYSIRQYYPDAPIVLINDGMDQFDYSEMAAKYNCIHVRKKQRNLSALSRNRGFIRIPAKNVRSLQIM